MQKPHTHSDITVKAHDLSNHVCLLDSLVTHTHTNIDLHKHTKQSGGGRGVARIQYRETGLAVLRLLWIQPLPFSLLFYLCESV